MRMKVFVGVLIAVTDDKGPLRRKKVRFQWEFPSCLTDICSTDDSEEEDLSEYYKESLDRLEVDLLCFLLGGRSNNQGYDQGGIYRICRMQTGIFHI